MADDLEVEAPSPLLPCVTQRGISVRTMLLVLVIVSN
jgi:hypothetical protein